MHVHQAAPTWLTDLPIKPPAKPAGDEDSEIFAVAEELDLLQVDEREKNRRETFERGPKRLRPRAKEPVAGETALASGRLDILV